MILEPLPVSMQHKIKNTQKLEVLYFWNHFVHLSSGYIPVEHTLLLLSLLVLYFLCLMRFPNPPKVANNTMAASRRSWPASWCLNFQMAKLITFIALHRHCSSTFPWRNSARISIHPSQSQSQFPLRACLTFYTRSQWHNWGELRWVTPCTVLSHTPHLCAQLAVVGNGKPNQM